MPNVLEDIDLYLLFIKQTFKKSFEILTFIFKVFPSEKIISMAEHMDLGFILILRLF